MRSLCHVVDKHYNSVVAIFRGWQVSYEVNADFLPTAFGDRQWLQKTYGCAAPVVGSMA